MVKRQEVEKPLERREEPGKGGLSHLSLHLSHNLLFRRMVYECIPRFGVDSDGQLTFNFF